MQQYLGDRASRLIHLRRTRPALPGSTSPTIAPTQNNVPQPTGKKRPDHTRRAISRLLGLGVLLEGLYLALYPGIVVKNDAARQAILGLFPWLPRLYWTTWLPHGLARISVIDPPGANLPGLLLACAFVLLLLAAHVGSRVVRERLTTANTRIIFWMMVLLTAISGLTFLCMPGMISQDVFLYGLYGRMVVAYHVNPYLVTLAAFPRDVLHEALHQGVREAMIYGPVWVDLSILVTLLAGASVAKIIIGFRLLGLVVHLLNVVLIWAILVRLKPEARVSGTLLYAWNPLVLLMSVAEMHQIVVVVLFVLLAVFLFQRKSLTLGWVFLLLATLINFWCLLLLPLYFRLLTKESHALRRDESFLWWSRLIGVSALVIALAYAPYWQGWGIAGVTDSLQETFFPGNAVNSLDAALLHVPLQLPPAVSRLIAPQHWIILAAIVVAVLLLLGLWLADTLKLVLSLSSWLFLVLPVFSPVYWPWYTLLPLVLAICATGGGTIFLAMLLTIGAALSYYYWLWQPPWPGQALVTVGLPLLLWGWTVFFISTWQMTHAKAEQTPARTTRGLSRPSWISRPDRKSTRLNSSHRL